jgi:Tfp pilus assembly protein PilN
MCTEQLDAIGPKIASVSDLNPLKARLLARWSVYQSLRSDRTFGPVQLLGDVSRRLPEGILLDSMELRGNAFQLVGSARTSGDLEQFVERLAESDLMGSPNVEVTLA